jgi:peptidoglycan/xylan/chitin deacetylase (PgdA/CDA1 family)
MSGHNDGALVLCYHSVSARWKHPLAVTPEAFEEQLAFFRQRGYRGASMDEIFSGAGRRMHVTFDDAFLEVLGIVPVLERLRIPATVFAVTEFSERGASFSVPELAAEAAVNGGHLETMSWDDLRGLRERSIDVGSHTVTHPHLPQLDGDELRRELRDSRERIEDQLGDRCRVVAYPFGEHDPRVQHAARSAGYAAGLGLSAGTSAHNRFAVPRLDLYRRDTALRFRMKASFVKPVASAMLSRMRALA